MATLQASLHGGPAAGRKLPLAGMQPGWLPDYMCVNMNAPTALSAHYRHIAGGVYEYQGACDEFDHAPGHHVRRCPDCGAQILGHPETGHRS